MKVRNMAFIDGQNLYMGTIKYGWKIDHKRFRIYLKEKYKVDIAYYFVGYFSEIEQKLYTNLKEAGFIVVFKQHHLLMQSFKKGNVDADIVFNVMKIIFEGVDFSRIVLVSGDGDYKILVDYLIQKDKFEKILFPNKKFASSLYKKLGAEYFDYIENLKEYIQYK